MTEFVIHAAHEPAEKEVKREEVKNQGRFYSVKKQNVPWYALPFRHTASYHILLAANTSRRFVKCHRLISKDVVKGLHFSAVLQFREIFANSDSLPLAAPLWASLLPC